MNKEYILKFKGRGNKMVELNLLQSSKSWKHIGMEIIRNSEGKPGIRIQNSENLKQIYGNVHGGFIAMAVDTASGVAVNDSIGDNRGAVTVELKVNYLEPIGESDIYAYAQVVRKGNRLLTCTVEVTNDEGVLAAIGITTFIVM